MTSLRLLARYFGSLCPKGRTRLLKITAVCKQTHCTSVLNEAFPNTVSLKMLIIFPFKGQFEAENWITLLVFFYLSERAVIAQSV
jgi:hypothetical protein